MGFRTIRQEEEHLSAKNACLERQGYTARGTPMSRKMELVLHHKKLYLSRYEKEQAESSRLSKQRAGSRRCWSVNVMKHSNALDLDLFRLNSRRRSRPP
jgi:hypothetical protein